MSDASVSFGYRTPGNHRIDARPWSVRIGDDELPPTDATVPDWDWFTPVHVERDLIVDIEGLREDCGLGGDRSLHVVLTWHASRTNIRGASTVVPLTAEVTTLSVDPPPTHLGGTLTIQSRLVLGTAGGPLGPSLAPRRPGSVLWSEELRLVLEGEGHRFPVLPVDFCDTGIAGGRVSSGWCLEGSDADHTASGVGSLRLLLNTANPAVRRLLEEPAALSSGLLAQFIRYDVGRQLVMAALQNEEITDRSLYEAGTLGDLLITFVRRAFGERHLDTLRGEYAAAPGEFEAELQARLRILDAPT